MNTLTLTLTLTLHDVRHDMMSLALVVVTSETVLETISMIVLIVGMIILTSPSNSFGRTDVNSINYFQ